MKLPITFRSDDSNSDETQHRRLLTTRNRGYGGAMALEVSKFLQYVAMVPPDTAVSVSKFLQYVAMVPPDTSVSVSKFLQYVPLVPPDAAVSVSKFLQYVVVEIVYTPALPRGMTGVWQRTVEDDTPLPRWFFRPRVTAPQATGAAMMFFGT